MQPSFSHPSIRLFVAEALMKGITLELPEDQAHYLRNVMRCELGTPLALFNGCDGEWRGSLASLGKKSATVVVEDCLREQQAEPDVWLLFAPVKHAHLEWLVDKAVELGASRLQPVRTERTQLSKLNVLRLCAHIVEAAEQCERLTLPDLDEMQPLKTLLKDWPTDRTLLFADECGDAPPLPIALQSLPEDRPLAILIGPEGGFSPEERSLLRSLPFTCPISMGPRILRADTAAAAALACVMSLRGDWNRMPAFRGQPQGEAA